MSDCHSWFGSARSKCRSTGAFTTGSGTPLSSPSSWRIRLTGHRLGHLRVRPR
jgi:hypothetical protein